MLTVACVWLKSDVFDSVDWVWRLYRMVDKRIGMVHRPYRFVCISPHAEKFAALDWVEVVSPIHNFPDGVKKHWYKVNLFDLDADRVIYFDLDVVIMGSIVPLIEFPSSFCVAPSSGVPMRGHDFNSSVMVWDQNEKQAEQARIELHRSKKAARYPYYSLYNYFAGDQQWLATIPMRVDLFPSRWISKYLPKGGVQHPPPETIVSLLIQGGKNKKLIEDGHTWIADYWR